MKTLLLQNQQIIIQQQNMMFMVMRQLQSPTTVQHQQHQHHSNSHVHQHPLSNLQVDNIRLPINSHHQHHRHQTSDTLNNQHHQSRDSTVAQLSNQHHPHSIDDGQSTRSHNSNDHHQHHHSQQQIQEQQLFSHPDISNNIVGTQQQLQQVASQLQENLGHYLTPAASEQDPISDKTEDDELSALLDGDGLLHDNLLYNPQTDIGSITPYKGHQEQHLTPSYYSSGCESLTTPRVDQPRQSTTTNISQNVVKNLADSFKSPTKPQINVQILPGSASGGLKNNKAKIIQRMNISKFLRQVHSDSGKPRATDPQ